MKLWRIMKVILIIIVVAVICILFSSCTDRKVDSKSEYYYYSWNKKKIYFKEIDIYHQWIPIPTKISNYDMNADAKTFEVLDVVVAKDKNYVYCWASKVDSVDALTFYHVSDQLYKDKNHVFIHESRALNILEDADPKTYRYFEYQSGLAKDKKGYFYNNKRISVDTSTFQVLSKFAYGGFDKNFVYAFGNAEPKTPVQGKLTKVNDKLLYDDDKVFHFTWQGRYSLAIIPIKNRNSFVVYASDENTIFKLNGVLYWNDYEIDNLDLSSFKYIGGSYAKDKYGVYIIRNIQNNNVANLPEADSSTFKYIKDNLAYDKSNVYYGGRIIPDADPNTIQKTKGGLKDKNHEWRWNRENKEWNKLKIE